MSKKRNEARMSSEGWKNDDRDDAMTKHDSNFRRISRKVLLIK